MKRLPALLAVLVAAILLAGCGVGPAPSPSDGRVTVVTTTTVLADMVRQIAGEHATVHALVPAGTDVHTFDPAPSDAIRVSRAGLLVMNGLGLDDWLSDFARQAGAPDTPVVELAEDLPGVEYLEGGERAEEAAAVLPADHAFNPHLWLNVAYARRYVARLADELASVDPANAATYRANAAAYDARLAELDSSIRNQFAALPAERRHIVSFHDAFPYFAAAYGLEIVGVLVEVPGQEPSAAQVAALIDAIRAAGVRVVLAESQFNSDLAQTVAQETAAQVVSQLYTDSLGDPPADSYEGAMRWNVEQILAGLR
jgi:zinc/manganese transport system substrate-binding protein/manganese/iron transport system substrate-binding protein